MKTIDLDTAVVAHRKLRHVGEAAQELHQLVDELLTAEDFPGLDATIDAAHKMQDRIRWVLGEPELEHRHARVEHLLDHGVRMVERLLDITDYEAEDEDLARGWLRRVTEHRDR
jgi:hypothetical protein